LKNILKNIYPYLFCLFCFVLPLDKYATAVPNIILILLLVSFPFVVKKNDFKKLVRTEVLVFSTLIAYIFINMVLFQDYGSDITVVKKIFSAFMLLILYIPIGTTAKLNKTIILSVLVCMVVSLLNVAKFYFETGEFNFADGGTINDILVIDRLYLGFLCVLSVIASIGLIRNNHKLLYVINIVLCILFALLISSRIAILLLLFLMMLLVFYSRNKKQYIFFFIGVFIITIAAFKLNKNLGERFFYTHNSESKKSYVELFMAWEPRVEIWGCSYKILTNKTPLLLGNGFYGTKNELVSCYKSIGKEDKRKYFIAQRFNPHNQFFDFLLSYGLIALVLFLAIFSILITKYRNSYYKMALIITIMAFAFIESYFQRQIGGYLFAIVFILIIYPMYIPNTKQAK
tara:strand:- start:56370 stop:57572 length:1203 start_codon:yes stop_codon:yes gene_type:complete